MTLAQLESALRTLAARAGLRDTDLPTFGIDEDNGRPHVENNGSVYYHVVCDHGVEVERTLFLAEDELMYHALKYATLQVASDQEVATRTDELHDTRRELFRIHEELMTRINPEWGARLASEYAELLRKYPFDDHRVVRLERFKGLMASGVEESEAWERACQEYPSPPSGAN